MSAYREQTTKIKNKDSLMKALEDKGYKAEYYAEGDNLVGYHGDKRSDTAEIIVRRKQVGSVSNDIGFKKGADGNYQAIISDYDRGKHNDKWLTELKDLYATHEIKKIAKAQGLQFVKSTTENGETKLIYRQVQA